MNIINLRKHVRRANDSRPGLGDRRNPSGQISAPEGRSGESASAKLNRRKAERRTKDRRKAQPFAQQDEQALSPGSKYARFKLTRGERNLIQDMFLSDLDEDKQ